MLDIHDQLAKQMIEKHRGALVKSTGDGILATFDGPGRGVRCALALRAASKQIGLPLRAGLHTGILKSGVGIPAASRCMPQPA
jgi:class 3 adenylate cyclase